MCPSCAVLLGNTKHWVKANKQAKKSINRLPVAILHYLSFLWCLALYKWAKYLTPVCSTGIYYCEAILTTKACEKDNNTPIN